MQLDAEHGLVSSFPTDFFGYFGWPTVARTEDGVLVVAHDETVERFTDNFAKPGNLQGGFNWYVSQAADRLGMLKGEARPPKPKIAVPTCVRWGDRDPILLSAWGDTLGDTFSDLDFAPFAGLGHFPHREDPDRSAAEIDLFFRGRLPG